ncbi:hypothetical protein [uncultured Marivirga sp.]|uniref:hypothetical protein n=1 Tax=uncultured Marivirga sp. TaxID=1123707 RepID=UPI0030EEA10F
MDGKFIIEQSFYSTACINLGITADWHDLANQINDWSDIVHEDLVQIDDAFKITKFDKQCYYTTASEKQVFYEFVQSYKDFVRDIYLENQGTERECYWRGIYDGFSLQLCYDSFKVKFVTSCETLPPF